MGSVSNLGGALRVAVVSWLVAGCAHAPESGTKPPQDDAEAGLRRDNATLRRRLQMLEDRVLKLEHRVDGPSAEGSDPITQRADDVRKLPDGRELPVIRLGEGERDPARRRRGAKTLHTQAQGGSVALEGPEHDELNDDRFWVDPSGYDNAGQSDDGSGTSYRLVGKELVRLTEPDREKPADREPSGASGRNLKSRYAAAIELYRAAAYAEAEAAFAAIAQDFPKSDYSDNAWYWKGESAYDQDHYSDALEAFTVVVERYGGGNKAPDALLKIGLCYDKLGDQANARDVLSQLVSAYPGATASDIARARLAELGS